MDIHTARDGEPTGIWKLDELQAALDSGKVLPTDLIWAEGYADWQPLHALAEGIGISLLYAEEDVPPIPSAELQSSEPIQTSPRHAVAAASVPSTNRGFPWLRLGVGVIGLSILVAIALPAYRNYRERASTEGLSAQSNGQNPVVSSDQTDAAPSPIDAKPESNASVVTAFPDRNTCEDRENPGYGDPSSRCNKLLLEKYGAHIKFNALSKHRDADGNESKSSDEYLVIRSENGAVKSYGYSDADGDHSTIPDPWLVFEPLNLLLVRVAEYGEEQSVDLIDLKSGIVSTLGDIDAPVFSPDGQRFLVNELEYAAEYPIATAIYKVISGKATKEISLGPSGENRDWWPIGARWTSSTSFEFTRGNQENTTWDEASQKQKSNGPRQVYTLEAGKWKQQVAEPQASSKGASAAHDQINSQNDQFPAKSSGDSINMNCLVRTETLKRWESGDMSGSAAAPAMIRALRKAQQDACNGDASQQTATAATCPIPDVQNSEPIACSKAPPMYPPNEARLGIQGTTAVIASIGTSGEVLNVEVEESSGSRNLDRAAVQAVRKWRFSPEIKGGKRVASRFRIPVTFGLNGAEKDATASAPNSGPPVPEASSDLEPRNARGAGFVVEVGTFLDATAASALRDKLRSAGLNAFTDNVNADSGKRTRVQVGPTMSRSEADALKAKIKAKAGIEGMIRPYP